MSHMKKIGFAVVAIFFMFLISCGSSDDNNNPSVNIRITQSQSVRVGETAVFTVTRQNSDDFELSVVPAYGSGCAKSNNNTVTCTPVVAKTYNITVEAAADKTRKSTAVLTVTASGVIDNEIVGEMIFVEGGTFTMGCTSEQGNTCTNRERPAHLVTLTKDFYIGKYPVTQAQWAAVMDNDPSREDNNLPVELVSWNGAQEFIAKLNAMTEKTYRLLTEAEWEYAARGGKESLGYRYSGSNDIEEVAWHVGNSGGISHPVGQKEANELGIYDMSGNVFEWVNDRYGAYRNVPQIDPQGPITGLDRVYRGGSSCGGNAWDVRVSARNRANPGAFSYVVNCGFGFRLAIDAESE